MAGYRYPGSVCASAAAEPIDAGTLCLWRTPKPACVCLPSSSERHWHAMSVPGGFPAAALRLGPEGAALLKGVETLRLEPYDDQTGTAVDKWVKGATIGYGHLIRKGEWATYEDGITEAEAAALFDADVAPYEAAVGLSITIGLQQHEFDALVIFAFNIGKGGFVGSSVVKLINNPKAITPYAGVEAAWMAWSRSQGKVMRGLYNRRRCEWQIYKQARYERW